MTESEYNMEFLERAVAYAAEKHNGQKRKGEKTPYIIHPMEVASVVSTLSVDPELLAAAVLHDVPEDTGTPLSEIAELFGERVAALVKTETEDKRRDLPPEETWQIRKRESLTVLAESTDPAVGMLWLGDKLANMRSFYRQYLVEGDGMWQHYHQKDPARHAWYYRGIADILRPTLGKTTAFAEYADLTEKVFAKVPKVRLQAHKGVEAEYPENTMVSFRAAVEQGYDLIELDIRVTEDGQFVVMHDRNINRTGRNPDGSELAETIPVSSVTYQEALAYDYGIRFSERFKGEKLPLFRDVLELSRANNIPLKIDNKIREFTGEQRAAMYRLIRASGAKVCVSCWNEESAEEVARELPSADVSFDGVSDPALLGRISRLVGREHLTVWIPVDFCMAKWAPAEWFLTPEQAESVRAYANIALWAIKDVESFVNACRLYHPVAVETTGTIKPADRAKI